MSNSLPISPVTGKPSALTAQIRRSVGIDEPLTVTCRSGHTIVAPVTQAQAPAVAPLPAQHVTDLDLAFRQKYAPGAYGPVETPNLRAQVRRGMGLDQPQPQPQQQAQVQRAATPNMATANEIAQAVTSAMLPLVTKLWAVMGVVEQSMAQRAQAAPVVPTPDTVRSVIRGGVADAVQATYGYPDLMPPSRPSAPAPIVVVTPATSPAGMANAMVNQSCHLEPALTQPAQRQPVISIHDAVRLGLQRGIY